jgi:hypothetical protein
MGIVTVKELLGHTNINCTTRYAHFKMTTSTALQYGDCGPVTK